MCPLFLKGSHGIAEIHIVLQWSGVLVLWCFSWGLCMPELALASRCRECIIWKHIVYNIHTCTHVTVINTHCFLSIQHGSVCVCVHVCVSFSMASRLLLKDDHLTGTHTHTHKHTHTVHTNTHTNTHTHTHTHTHVHCPHRSCTKGFSILNQWASRKPNERVFLFSTNLEFEGWKYLTPDTAS